jgi:peptidoglycan/LPS O-acetylase OafA/YrhL
VLSVLAFHLGVPGFSGGFVGVDIFFVISGYLITGLIKRDIELGAFSFQRFYLRRARRILPMLFVTILVSYGAGFLLLIPEHFRQLGVSGAAAAVSLSNLYFWAHSGYFDLAAKYQPLLHTWSLSVEEQFYLAFPLFLAVVSRLRFRAALPVFVAVAGFASLLISIAVQHGHTSLIDRMAVRLMDTPPDGMTSLFYLPIFRAFEFAIGALPQWLPAPRDRRVQEAFFALGIATLGYVITSYNDKMAFPAANALPPCFGAALCIHAGTAERLGIVLRNPLAGFIGKISYSVYLIHWPLLIFVRYYLNRELEPIEAGIIFLLSLSIGYASYQWIEQPCRRQKVVSWRPLLGYASAAVAVSFGGAVITAPAVFRWRLGDDMTDIAFKQYEVGGAVTTAYMGSLGCPDLCEFGNLDNPNITIVAGDSIVDHYTKALLALSPDRHFKLIQAGSCFIGSGLRSRPRGVTTQVCRAAEAEMKTWIAKPTVIEVIHAQRWPGYRQILEGYDGTPKTFASLDALYTAQIDDLVELYQSFKGRLVIINPPPVTNLACIWHPLLSARDCRMSSRIEELTFASMLSSRLPEFRGAAFVDPEDILCKGEVCRNVDSGTPLYSNENHLTVAGARLIVPSIIENLTRHRSGRAVSN